MRPRNEQLKRDKRMAKGGGYRDGKKGFIKGANETKQ